ncbi:MAG: hypothetical protein ACYC0T_12945 [Ramlibacter sp.]
MNPQVRKVLAYAAAAAVLLGVFALYTRPELMITISEQVWACFQ